MAEFDLASVLRDVNAQDLGQPGREQIVYLDIGMIDDDPANFYDLSGLEELASNIELIGQQQPARVRVHPDNPSRYMIVSGHRRRAARQLLVREGKEQFRMMPCIIEKPASSAALQELRLIFANSDTRRMTAAEISRQAERVEMLLYELKEEGMEFPGRMRDHVAEACKVSKSKLSRLKVIREKLIPIAQADFQANRISEDCAYKLAQEPARVQEIIYNSKYNDVKYGLKSWQVDNGAQRIMAIDRISCDGHPCENRERMYERSLRNDMYSPCRVCCSNCSEFMKCGKVCDKLKGRRAEIKKEQERLENERKQEAEAKRLAETIVREKIDAEEEALLAQRWVNWGRLREHEGLTLHELYTMLMGVKWLDDDDYREIVKLERGQQPDSFAYDPLEWIDYSCEAVRFADEFGCTIDFLYGRTDELRPGESAVPVWRDIDTDPLPEEGDEVIVLHRMVPKGKLLAKVAVYRGCMFKEREYGMAISGVVAWQPYLYEDNNVPESGTDEESEDFDD